MTYNFAYDAVGRPTTVKVGTQTLSTTTYNADGTVANVTYGNGGKVVNAYDDFKRVTGVRYDNETTDHLSYTYGANGEVARVKDNVRGTTVTSEYDVANRPQRKTTTEGSTHAYTGEATYDQYNNLATFKEQVGSGRTAYTTTFTYDNENRPIRLNFGGTRQVGYAYDGIGRISQRTVNAGGTAVATAYGYLAGGHGTGSTTPLVQTIIQSDATLTYAYDDAGNITSVSDGVKTISYAYDLLGQLIRANDPYDTTAGSNGTTWLYSYDLGGNILSKTAYAYTTGTVGAAVRTDSFTYGDANWKDKLTAYNGAAISYDTIGNPVSDGTWTYTWAKGRQLQSMSKSGETVSFTYNEDGLRVQKAATSTGTTKYTLHGKNIVHMTNGSNTLHFFYDAQNKPAVVLFNGTAYVYLYNLQGDVIALVDTNGSKVVEYKYDAWGNPLSKTGTLATTLGTLQPFRYRGYAYDEETCCYYLYNRYYSPKWSRFINADAANLIVDTSDEVLGANLFSYCENDPVNCHDESGNFSLPNWAKVAIGAVVIAGLAIATVATAGTAAVVCGAALSGAVAGATSGAVVGSVTGALENGWEGAIDGACSGFLSGTVIGGVSGAASAGFNILTKATRIVGKAYGTILHKLSSNMQAGRMASSGRYSQIGLNKALKTMGLNGGLQRPDVIGIGKNGTSKLVEVVSLKQNELSVMNKMSKMLAANPNSTGKVVMWVRNIGKTLY